MAESGVDIAGDILYDSSIDQCGDRNIMNVAKTILDQIEAIDACAMLAWGAKDLVNTGKGLQFRVGGLAKFKGLVHVRYDEGNDLYNVEFIKIKKGMPEVVKKVEGVFCECLVDVIDATVQ